MIRNKLAVLSIALGLLSITGCETGMQTMDEVREEFPDEVSSVTKVSFNDDYKFYVPDSYLEESEPTTTSNEYMIYGDEFVVYALYGAFNVDSDSEYASLISAIENDIDFDGFEMQIGVVESSESSDFCAEVTAQNNDVNYSGYLRALDNEITILALRTDDKNSINQTIVESLENDKQTYVTQISDAGLAAEINGVSVGESNSINDVADDLATLGESFEDMKASLTSSDVIIEQNETISATILSLSDSTESINQCYIDSLKAYSDAVDQYNLTLSNGIDLMSSKTEVIEALGINSWSEDFNSIVVENSSTESAIKEIIVNFNNENIESITVISNSFASFQDKLSSAMSDYSNMNDILNFDDSSSRSDLSIDIDSSGTLDISSELSDSSENKISAVTEFDSSDEIDDSTSSDLDDSSITLDTSSLFNVIFDE